MKKKLLIFIPHINVGGVEKNLYLVANYLAKRIEQISIITVNKEFTNKLDKKIKIISPKSNKWENSRMYTKYLISIYLLVSTLIFDRNYLIFSFQANWYAIIVTKLLGLKIVSRSNTAPEGWSKNNIKKFFYKLVINAADKIIVNSYEFKKSLKKYFNVNSKCIYNPLNKAELIKLSRKKINFNFFKKNNYLNIINIGRFTDQKNQILLLKSMKYLNNKIPIKLLIIGRGKNYVFLKNYIVKNKLKNIMIKDNVSNPYPYLRISDIFILSSNYEGLPNVLLEAQFFKKLIISTRCPTGPKEILLNGKAGIFFKMNDYKDLSKKIITLSKKNKEFNRMINIGFKNLSRFDEKTNLSLYYQTIKQYL